ncbi:Piso0_004298 [Millerozyma farinosa CBS 7064]|uniref:Piso0_004298 protein n=1 Tax=Pichia sorbitophila (strain ATCC MYA-4447 / BCRC 22081 / CBS 7064 / NBRC 10061 / NRRL Y-12695) TaxID=559304 RepID=G8Y8E8_PICSO|nr:Piso0_004298 [Millerozyma farinosa CBS 7064]CCE84743.1 Piso0_004298 [Millerozyma farinosa CBS 7064]
MQVRFPVVMQVIFSCICVYVYGVVSFPWCYYHMQQNSRCRSFNSTGSELLEWTGVPGCVWMAYATSGGRHGWQVLGTSADALFP